MFNKISKILHNIYIRIPILNRRFYQPIILDYFSKYIKPDVIINYIGYLTMNRCLNSYKFYIEVVFPKGYCDYENNENKTMIDTNGYICINDDGKVVSCVFAHPYLHIDTDYEFNDIIKNI